MSGSVSFYELDVNKLSFHFTLEYSSRNSLSYEISRSLENKCLALFVASMHISSGVLLSLRQTPAQLGSRRVLTFCRVRYAMSRGNQIYSVNVRSLGIPKIYMGTLGY